MRAVIIFCTTTEYIPAVGTLLMNIDWTGSVQFVGTLINIFVSTDCGYTIQYHHQHQKQQQTHRSKNGPKMTIRAGPLLAAVPA